jgi:hypothetical protein
MVGTLFLWNGKDPDEIKKQDPDPYQSKKQNLYQKVWIRNTAGAITSVWPALYFNFFPAARILQKFYFFVLNQKMICVYGQIIAFCVS